MKLVFVYGAPATGKTTLALRITEETGWPLISKDELKEKLYSRETARHGWSWYEKRAKDTFFDSIKSEIEANRSIVVEANFLKSDGRRLKQLIKENVQMIEIYCFSSGFARFYRFVHRSQTKTRVNKLHRDRRFYATTFIECALDCIGVQWPYRALDISGKLVSLDTTDFSKVPYNDVLGLVRTT